MALNSQVIVATVGAGDPLALRRLAVRFSKPVFPDSDLKTAIWTDGARGGVHRYVFESTDPGGGVVVKDGWAEIGPARV